MLKKMHAERWSGGRDEGDTVPSPTWETVEEAIRRLDGKSRTSIFLYITDDLFMGIGGGNSGLYTVMIDSPELDVALNLVDASKSEREVTLVVGGQSAGYPERMCVDLPRVLHAVKAFTETGQPDDTGSWEE